ncbi:hypothetical protein HII36_43620 [Nonomuraea sp. NN258]|uniref:hypothetical protein n=1 Tax=Nonomuraea antri TaxID=2730852 RepID=UPI00156804CE|nr:hypothetical protein [Nonomuraea antri]NRQ38668.1 hypothetical protein [Nonomuraea antri]
MDSELADSKGPMRVDRDRYGRFAVVVASLVLLPLVLELLSWYIEREDYSVSRAVTVLTVIVVLAVLALVLGRIRARLPLLLVAAMTVTAVGEGVLGFVAAFGPIWWGGGVRSELFGLITAGVSAFTVATGLYLMLLYSRGLYLPHLTAPPGPLPSATKRKVIGESEILIRTVPEPSASLTKALDTCVAMLDQDDLHFVGYFTGQRCLFYTDVLDDADLAHFFHETTQEQRRLLYLQAGTQLQWLTARLDRQLSGIESGSLIRTVLDVERGALYLYWVDADRYLIGVTLDQRKVDVADDKMARLVDAIRGHFALPPINQRDKTPETRGHLRPVSGSERWSESGS